MRRSGILGALFLAAMLAGSLAFGQDGQALGDAARQARQRKKAKTGQSQAKDSAAPKPEKVITDDEIPSQFQRVSRVSPIAQEPRTAVSSDAQDEKKIPAEQWKSQIAEQKNQIASLQSQIDQMNESIRFAPANCVSNCAQWNQRQREKQQQLESMKTQLDDQQRRLEDMQEQARKQGYGSLVYDP